MRAAVFRFLNELYLDPGSGTGLYFLPLYVVCSCALFWAHRRRHPTEGPWLKSLANYVFPWRVYAHPSARLDFKMLLLNAVVAASAALVGFTSGFRFTAFLGSLHRSAHDVTLGMLAHPSNFPGLFQWRGFWLSLGFTLALAVFKDFARVLVHYPMHKIPALWEIHKVHHNAEVLTPFTVYRLHPLESGLSSLSGGLCHGVCVALFIYLFGPDKISLVTILGFNAVRLITNAFGVFEHDTKWFSLGRVGFIFASPANHLVHHSAEMRHRDKNFANHFAFIDLMLGTLYIPQREEHFRIGVDRHDGQPLVIRSLWRHFYLNPVVDLVHRLLRMPIDTPTPQVAPAAAACNCWCGPQCKALADPASAAAQPAPAWTRLGDLWDGPPRKLAWARRART